jgi:hypothetical protein
MAHSSVIRLLPRPDRLPPGLTSRGWDLLARAKDAFIHDQRSYTMVEKVHLLWDLGDAWSQDGWFTESEKCAAQRIIEDSAAAGTDSFMPQLWRFEREKSQTLRRIGPAPAPAHVLARLRGYREPWQRELLEDELVGLEIDVIVARRKARLRKVAGVAGVDPAHFDDPTARRLRTLYEDYQGSQRVGSWRERRDAASRYLDLLRRIGSAPPLAPCALALEEIEA